MGHDFDTQNSNSAVGNLVAAPLGAPGKSPRTARIPGQPRNEDYETICDGTIGDPLCPLSPEMRGRALAELGDAVGAALENERDAIDDELAREMAHSAGGFPWWADMLFYELAGPFGGIGARVLEKAFARMAGEALARGLDRAGVALAHASLKGARFKSIIGNATKSLRKPISDLTKSGPDKGAVEFLRLVRSQISSVRFSVQAEARTLDDIELQAMIMAYEDTEAHSIESYASAIKDLLKQYRSNHIDDVGRVEEHHAVVSPDDLPGHSTIYWHVQHGRLAWVTMRHERRLALLKITDDETAFRQFIDRGFETLALTVYEERTGRAPDEVNIDGAPTAQCPWAHSARASMIWCGG